MPSCCCKLQGEGQHSNVGIDVALNDDVHPYVPASIRRLRQLLKGIPVGMLTTHASGGVAHSRPMLVNGVDESGWLWFMTDRHSRKAWELGQNPQATISFQSPKGDRYVSVQGTAVVVRDNVKLKKLWTPTMRVWFPKGRRDPELVLVAVRVDSAEYWLVPRRRIARLAGAAKTMLTGRRDAGRHGVLELHERIA